MRKVLVAVAMLLALVACDDPPEHGVVIGKEHKDAYSWVQMVCAAYNNGMCTVWVPITHHVPERWSLCLRAGDDTGCRDVDQPTWTQYSVGDYYDPS